MQQFLLGADRVCLQRFKEGRRRRLPYDTPIAATALGPRNTDQSIGAQAEWDGDPEAITLPTSGFIIPRERFQIVPYMGSVFLSYAVADTLKKDTLKRRNRSKLGWYIAERERYEDIRSPLFSISQHNTHSCTYLVWRFNRDRRLTTLCVQKQSETWGGEGAVSSR